MITTLIILWLLIGLASVWRIYHGLLRDWYNLFGESAWKEGGCRVVFIFLFIMSPFLVIGGLVSVVTGELIFYKKTCWYFTTKNKN